MLEHLRHQLRSGRYNQRGLLSPRRILSLSAAWYRNEIGYLRRTSRLASLMGTDAGALSDALGESKEVMEYCNRGLGEHRDVLPPLLQRLGEVDCFLHDSDHSYEHMAWEFSQAYPYVRAGGLLMSDDITSNRAWDEFTAGSDGPSTRINRLGVFRVPPSANADGNQPGRSQ